jgi:D-alanyl-lipoteichoic acid acyltransferase DltB (MBOAT superfamily)
VLFSSFEYIFLFLPVAIFFYFGLIKIRLGLAAKAWLVFSSLFFYSWWNISNLPLILCSMLFNYATGTALSASHQSVTRKQILLTLGISANITALGYYKYSAFAVSNINHFCETSFSVPHVVLPLAISFFTFQQIAYLVDSYRQTTSEYDFLNYALFVTFFPQLIAGPIVHHKEMMPQFSSRRRMILQKKNIENGLFLFSIGLFKKCVLADTFGIWVQQGYAQQTPDMIMAWQTTLAYTIQLYTDFSGYMDMALGTALLFNITLPTNFNSPYKSLDIQDFWRRWHITLGRFLRDYVYIPLGGNRKGKIRLYTNLMLTFLLGGLWHGAGWTFILWGGLHGAALCIHRLWKKNNGNLPTAVAGMLTFSFVHLAWIPFRAESLEKTIQMLKGLTGFYGSGRVDISTWQFLLPVLLIIFLCPNSREIMDNTDRQRKKLLTFFIGTFALLQLTNITTAQEGLSEFLYFNF